VLTDPQTALRVLLIEDDDGDALLVREELEDAGAFPDGRGDPAARRGARA
jgi:hypothetical protein